MIASLIQFIFFAGFVAALLAAFGFSREDSTEPVKGNVRLWLFSSSSMGLIFAALAVIDDLSSKDSLTVVSIATFMIMAAYFFVCIRICLGSERAAREYVKKVHRGLFLKIDDVGK